MNIQHANPIWVTDTPTRGLYVMFHGGQIMLVAQDRRRAGEPAEYKFVLLFDEVLKTIAAIMALSSKMLQATILGGWPQLQDLDQLVPVPSPPGPERFSEAPKRPKRPSRESGSTGDGSW